MHVYYLSWPAENPLTAWSRGVTIQRALYTLPDRTPHHPLYLQHPALNVTLRIKHFTHGDHLSVT